MSTYAVIDYKTWRVIDDISELVAGETAMDSIPSPTSEQSFTDYCKSVSDGVSAWLSEYVHANFGYDDIVSAASYANDPDPKFKAEGTASVAWRSDCFKALYAAIPAYSSMAPDQWPDLRYITANLPQPSAYNWEPA